MLDTATTLKSLSHPTKHLLLHFPFLFHLAYTVATRRDAHQYLMVKIINSRNSSKLLELLYFYGGGGEVHE